MFESLSRYAACSLLAAATLMGAAAAHADTAANVRAKFTQMFPNAPVEAVNDTPYGLYEVVIGGDELVYTDANVSYVLQGTLIDTASRRNVTAERVEQLSAVSFDELPMQLAFKQVHGDGSRQLAVFEDPYCGYCKQFRKTLANVDDITIHTFMYPMLTPDSPTKVRNVWCSADKGATWDAWMLQNQEPATAECDAPIDQMLELGRKLRVRGTPTIIFADGSRASGALPEAMLLDRLNTADAP
ncbi:DsbC family protein [Verticiella sediminum]|uniref:Thiol:disulfide interchange protein n=1 Tax=Verticiella sediminum TaxID=1247510 RepID=A0A556AJ01_9BURK|nr:DsbC family protein [Verticiella sediminum]TSH92884.1 DsbC family protein [Verticiella sediminum]